MKLIRKNMKLFVVIYLIFCVSTFMVITDSFAVQKPSYLAGAGDAEAKASDFLTSLINWAAALAIGFGTLGIIAGGIMLVPVLGQQSKAKFFFLGGAGAIVVGVAGLSIASWLYDKMS